MNEPSIVVRVEPGEDGMLRVLAPRVGRWSDLPEPGSLVGPGSRIGMLTRLNRRVRLVLPEGAAGQVVDGLPHAFFVPVEFGQVLFRLAPVDARVGGGDPGAGRSRGAGLAGGEALPPGTRAVLAPTDGVFYCRPSPDAEPFVSVGDRVSEGQPIGLVEVMKTFNPIAYGGAGLPVSAEVVEVRVEDGTEVTAGRVLLVVR